MKLLIASDIHGSLPACRAVLAALERDGADRLVLLGDLLYHGPRNPLPEGYAPQEVAKLLNQVKEKLFCVRGNCDAEIDQMLLEFPIMADYACVYDGKTELFLTHGHIFNRDNPPPMSPKGVLLNGHFHVKSFERLESGLTCVNPGSAGCPKDGSASYLEYEDGEFTFRDLDGQALNRRRL